MRVLVLLTLLLAPSLAHAMAQVIQVVGLVVSYYFPIIGIVIMLAGGVYGAEQQRKAAARAQQDAKNAYNNGLQDRTVTRVATDAPFVYVYGRARVGSAVVGMFSSGANDQYKHLVCVHAAHECDGFEEIYINGIALGTLDGSGDVIGGNYSITNTLSNTEFKTTASFSLAYMPLTGTLVVFLPFIGVDGGDQPLSFTLIGASVTITDPAYVSGTSVTCTYQYQTMTSRVRVQKHLGVATDPSDATLLAEVPSKWTSTAVLRGLCYTVVRLDLHQPEFQSGLPSVEVLLRGKKLFDPRDSSTLWSQNPALAIQDYLTSEMCGVVASDLPSSDYIAAANVCSPITGCTYAQSGTTVTVTKTAHGLLVNDVREMQILTGSAVGGHYKLTTVTANTFTYTAGTSLTTSGNVTIAGLYTINGTVTADQDQSKTLESMAQAMAGFIVATTWSIMAGKYIAPVVALDQSDIVGALSVLPGTSDANLYNGVKGQYTGVETSYVATDFPPYQNSAYVAADRRELWTNISFPFTDSAQRVRNLCTIFTEDQRNGYTVTASFSMKVWALPIGARVTLTSTFLGQVAKVYRITDKKYSPYSAVELSLKEDVSTIWDFDGTATIDDTPNTNLPNPFAIAPLTSLTCLSDVTTVLVQSDGTLVPRILASWPQATTQAVVTNGFIEIEWQRAGDPAWQKISIAGTEIQTYLSPANVGAFYTVRARTVNLYMNIKSDWVYAAHQVQVALPLPANVTSFTVQQSGAIVVFKWNKLNSVTINGYDIGYAPQGTTDWAQFEILTEAAKGTEMTNAAVPPGTWVFAIRARDVINQLSPVMAAQDLIVTNANLSIIQSVEEIGWNGTLVGLVEHYTGVLVPDSQHNADFYTGWEVFDQWVPDPVSYIEYTSPALDASYDEALRVYQTDALVLGVGQSGTPNVDEFIDTWLTAGSDLGVYTPWVIGTLMMRYLKGRISATIAQGGLFMITDYTLNADMSPVVETPPSNVTVGASNVTVTNFPAPFHYPPFVVPVVVSGGTSVTASNITTTGCVFHVWTGSSETGGVLTYTATGE